MRKPAIQLLLLAFVLIHNLVFAAEQTKPAGTLSAPETVTVGGVVRVLWDGESDRADFISIDDPSIPDASEYGSTYGYPGKKNPLNLRAPTEPGVFVLRYHLGAAGHEVIATKALTVIDATATVTAPASAKLGTNIRIDWNGPNNRGDFISITSVHETDKLYGPHYGYPSKGGNPLKIRVPDEPGQYEIRYHLERSYRVLGKTNITITDVEASVAVQAEVEAGSQVKVDWTGPDGNGDFISIDGVELEDDAYGKKYSYTRKGSPLKIDVPQQVGEYQVRYHLARTYRVIASAPLSVIDIAAELSAPPTVGAGSEFEVGWTGPGYQGDFISVDALDGGDREYGNGYGYPREPGKPVVVTAPDDPGNYQLRYHLKHSYRVLGNEPLVVAPATASIVAPEVVEAGGVVEVEWEGPNNPYDSVALFNVATAAAETEVALINKVRGIGYSLTRRGNPSRIEVPKRPGEYELRYLTGQKYYTLASHGIRVAPSATPGALRVVSHTGPEENRAPFGAVEMVLDASGSMLQRLDGERRIDLAKGALVNLVKDVLPSSTPFALRVFGHKEPDKCRTDLEIALAPLNAKATVARIESIRAMNLAKTPIAESLQKIENDLAGVEGPALIILVTDGEETCDGNPAAAIERLQQAGFDVRVNVVGFAIDELDLKEQFEAWARQGNGRYVDAQNADQLNRAIAESMNVPFEVRREGEVVATGIVNGEPLALKPGSYQVYMRSDLNTSVGEVTIEAERESELVL